MNLPTTARRRRTAPTILLTSLLAGVLAGSLLTGCSADDPGTRDEPDARAVSPSATLPGSDGPDPASTPEPGRYPTYVAIGDSFTAAPLAGPTADQQCLRSAQNYPAQVAEALGAELTDVSCTGADTSALVGAQRVLQGGVVPPQFDALGPDTRLVTIGIGGNDFDIYSLLTGSCVQAAQRDPDGAPCRSELGAEGVAELRKNIRTVGERLVAVVEGVRQRAPRAEVVVVGYPEIVPGDATCPDLLPLATGDVPFAATMAELLADVQERAAKRADVAYVDTYAASDGHDVCSEDPWINGRVTSAATALAYHPLKVGQEAVAGLVLEQLADR
ncbi:SGNH/GDSL hydrolase family protein [Nocardioides marmotae]|uniref:SGNH/GDSL hydrolase family protein n=1 Tax=Nocardioides marmotae TaxID=2663857 RepID=UPI0014960D77|nr:SGNH/GDSL hydrolase family protein [Nocardioides marmotae]MBC9732584.1 SGNH/GDSL hydrolase family protein [Nocardioides marmotae]QKE03054.1 SGNH/GDSL hydrolase family protein [Nocardioides marmotae]